MYKRQYEIKLKLSHSTQVLDKEDFALIKQLELLDTIMISINSLSGKFDGIKARISSSLIELKDIFEALMQEQEQIELDPQKIEELSEVIVRANLKRIFQILNVDIITPHENILFGLILIVPFWGDGFWCRKKDDLVPKTQKIEHIVTVNFRNRTGPEPNWGNRTVAFLM